MPDLYESLHAIHEPSRTECRLREIASVIDDTETKTMFINALISPKISNRQIHKILQDTGHPICRTNLGIQRKCMISDNCKCDWDNV